MVDTYDGLTVGDILTEDEIQRKNPRIYENSLRWNKSTGKIENVTNATGGGGGGGTATDIQPILDDMKLFKDEVKKEHDDTQTILTPMSYKLVDLVDNMRALVKTMTVVDAKQEFHIKDVNNATNLALNSLKVKVDNVFTSMDIEVVGNNCTIKDLDTGSERTLVAGAKLNSGNGISISDLSRITLTGSFKFTWEERAVV